MFIKLSVNNSTRKIKLADDVSLALVKAEIVKMFGEKAKDMSLCYKDSESETITVTSEEDWEVCVEEFKEKNQGKPTLSVSLSLVQSDEFVSVNDSRLEKAETSVAQDESEIKEELKLTQASEELSDDKIIEENKEEEISEKEVEEPEVEHPQIGDQIIETQIKVPINENTKVEDLRNIAQNYSQHLSSLLGFPVDVLEARIESSDKDEESFAEESVSSTLTTEQRTEIEDIIEQKMSNMLNMKKSEKKAPTKEFAHWNITCDGCKKGIKNMARFKSLVKQDYDLCEECEKSGIHNGPMVKYNAPSKYSPWQLNNKFRDISQFFEHETAGENQSPRVSAEGFRMPHHGHHGHNGPFAHGPCGRFRHARPGHPGRGPFGGNPQDFFKNLNDTMKPLGDIFNQVLPGVFSHFTAAHATDAKPKTEDKKDVSEPKKCDKKESKKCHKAKKESKKESKKEAKKEEKIIETKEEKMSATTLAQKVTEEVPEFNLDIDILESIINEYGFTSVEQVVTYLL